MHTSTGNPVRYVGQRSGANYAPAYPGEHVEFFESLYEVAEMLRQDRMSEPGDAYLLWRVSPYDSEAECVSATLSDAAHADRIVTIGPRGGIRTERI